MFLMTQKNDYTVMCGVGSSGVGGSVDGTTLFIKIIHIKSRLSIKFLL